MGSIFIFLNKVVVSLINNTLCLKKLKRVHQKKKKKKRKRKRKTLDTRRKIIPIQTLT